MATAILKDLAVKSIKKAGRYADGGGLYLDVKKSGAKTWLFRYQINGKRKWMGLGNYEREDDLADIRSLAMEKRKLLKIGIDPIKHKAEKKIEKERVEREQEKEKALKEMTFSVCAKDYIERKQDEWSNEKHIQQWTNTLTTYAFPFIGDMPVKDIEIDDIKRCLDPIWSTKTETASRVRQRIETILSYAEEYRTTANPATWKGRLDKHYGAPEKVKEKRREAKGEEEHHNALRYKDMPLFMVKLKAMDGVAAKALRLTILTACRTREIRLAKWGEFDLERKEWNIPKARMKARKAHRVALSDAAIELIESLPRVNDFVFTGWKYDSPMSDGAMLAVLKRMDMQSVTVHGMRSTFRDYIGEETGFPYRLAEYALAHQLKDGAEKAYARGDMLKKRFKMMNAWAAYVDGLAKGADIIPIHRAG